MIAFHWNRSGLQCNKLAVKACFVGHTNCFLYSSCGTRYQCRLLQHQFSGTKAMYRKNGFKSSVERQQKNFPSVKPTKSRAAFSAKQHLIPSIERSDTQGMGIVEYNESTVERKVSHWNKVCCGCRINYSPCCISPANILFQMQSHSLLWTILSHSPEERAQPDSCKPLSCPIYVGRRDLALLSRNDSEQTLPAD